LLDPAARSAAKSRHGRPPAAGVEKLDPYMGRDNDCRGADRGDPPWGGGGETMSREALIATIVDEARETGAQTGRPAISPRVLDALRRVPRERFVRPGDAACADLDVPLAIGHGQTISQPFIVALMTELLDVAPGAHVLEIGTGSGYQAAVLAALGAEVCSIEVIPALAAQARATLAACGYAARLKVGDGSAGWPEQAPFDAIIVTAATPRIPPALVAQLKPGGRMVLPLGEPGAGQVLTAVDKQADGRIVEHPLLPVAFVPLVHG
jgi:protein-L-isoaspartate(D-aspartate) O-methyltransferase